MLVLGLVGASSERNSATDPNSKLFRNCVKLIRLVVETNIGRG